MRYPQTITQRILCKPGNVCVLLPLLLATSCATSADTRTTKKFSRLGESVNVPYGKEAVSNAVVFWARTLTNGYVLLDDRATRLKHMSLTNDPGILFSLRNGTNFIGAWGNSACLPPEKSSYWAEIIIRVRPAAAGSRVSVAIHGGHFARGLAFNIHTYEIDREKDVDLPHCPQDERALLKELESTLRKAGEANPPPVPHKR